MRVTDRVTCLDRGVWFIQGRTESGNDRGISLSLVQATAIPATVVDAGDGTNTTAVRVRVPLLRTFYE